MLRVGGKVTQINKKETWKINSLESKYCTWLALPSEMTQGSWAQRIFLPILGILLDARASKIIQP